MTGANYLTNRDATNRKPIEDDKWTDIHLQHCMLRSGASTQRKACPEVLVSLKRWISDVTGVDTPNSVRTQQWRRYIVTVAMLCSGLPATLFPGMSLLQGRRKTRMYGARGAVSAGSVLCRLCE